MMGYFGSSGWGGWGMLGGLMMVLFWVLIVLAVVALLKWLASQNGSGQNTALDVLKTRYAKGEIDKKEFEEKKKDLV